MNESPRVGEAQIGLLVQQVLGSRAHAIERQTRTQSGNAVFRARLGDGRDVAVRVSPHERAFAHTRSNLAILGGLGLPVQTVLAEGRTAAGEGFIMLDWLPGRDLVDALPALDAGEAQRLAVQVTALQRRVGALPVGVAFGWAPIGGRGGFARWTDMFGDAVPDEPPSRGLLPPLAGYRARLRALRASLEAYFAVVQPVCFLDDLTIKNGLVEDGALAGVIDVDFVCYGDPLMALGATLAHLDADLGAAGRVYGEALLACRDPRGEALRATGFYAALWATGFLAAAQGAGEIMRAVALLPVVERLMAGAEG